MISSEKGFSYNELFQAWKTELYSDSLSPLNLNFIKNYSLTIEEFKNRSIKDPFIKDIFLQRWEFLINNLIELRKDKIMEGIIRKIPIETSFLSRQELLFHDYIKNSDFILQNKPIVYSSQMKDFFEKNSNLNLLEDVKKITNLNNDPIQESKHQISEDLVKVVFLKDLDQFIYKNGIKYGPFKTNDIAEIPHDLLTNILGPKSFARLL